MSVISTLVFNAVQVDQTTSTATVSPNFLCPFCVGRPQSKLPSAVAIPSNRDLNINRLVIFTLLCCGRKVSLYVAVHKTLNIADLAVCIQRSDAEGASGIPANWWNTA